MEQEDKEMEDKEMELVHTAAEGVGTLAAGCIDTGRGIQTW